MIVKSDFEKYFLIEGRRYVRDGRLFLNHSGASLQGVFTGESLFLDVSSEAAEKGRNAYIRVTIDGRTRRVRLPIGEKTLRYTLPAGKHAFEVIKLTETANNTFAIGAVEADGDFEKPQDDHTLRIEFIGDSISTGFGVLAPHAVGEYKTKEQDVTKAFPYLVSRALNASYNVIAAGGWPVYKSKYADSAIPDYYDNVDLVRVKEPWDFASFVPDVTVVTLGTNDHSYLSELTGDTLRAELAETKRRAVRFLRHIRDLYPETHIVLFYGFYPYPSIETVTREVAAELGDPRLTLLSTPSAHSLEDVRAGHPGKRTHRIAAKRLTKHIKGILK